MVMAGRRRKTCHRLQRFAFSLPLAQPHTRAGAAVLLDEYYAGGLWGARRTAKSLAAVMEVSRSKKESISG
jgi:hypothetical protein